MIVMTSEWEVEQWFKENFKALGFLRIEPIPIPYRKPSFGDYLGWKGNKVYRIELELYLAGFFNHKPHVREKIDVIVCCRKYARAPRDKEKGKELEEKEVIEIPNCEIESSYADIFRRALLNSLLSS